jgi:hypothetical protein
MVFSSIIDIKEVQIENTTIYIPDPPAGDRSHAGGEFWDSFYDSDENPRSRSRSRTRASIVEVEQHYDHDPRGKILDISKWPPGYYWQLLTLGGYKRFWTIIEQGEGKYPGTWTVWFNEDGSYNWIDLKKFLEWK